MVKLRKAFSMILTLMLALSMSIPAHAAETEASVSDIEYFPQIQSLEIK